MMQEFGLSMLWYWLAYVIVTIIFVWDIRSLILLF